MAKKVAMWCCKDLRPFTAAEDQGLLEVVQEAYDMGVAVGKSMHMGKVMPVRNTVKRHVVETASTVREKTATLKLEQYLEPTIHLVAFERSALLEYCKPRNEPYNGEDAEGNKFTIPSDSDDIAATKMLIKDVLREKWILEDPHIAATLLDLRQKERLECFVTTQPAVSQPVQPQGTQLQQLAQQPVSPGPQPGVVQGPRQTQWVPKTAIAAPKPFTGDKRGEDLDTWLRAVPVYVRCKLTLPHEEVLVAASYLEGSAARWLSGLVQLQGHGHDFRSWAASQKLEDFLKMVEERWHNPQGAQKAIDAILTLHTRQYKSVREATDAVERLICVPGVRYDPPGSADFVLEMLIPASQEPIGKRGQHQYAQLPSFSKVALDLEAKIGHGQTPTTDGRKKTLPPIWKAKGRIMFVDNDGSTIELDGNFQEGVGAEAGGDTSKGGVVAAVTQQKGQYFPGASMHSLPTQTEGCTVSFNFGPEFWLPPKILKDGVELVYQPMSKAPSFVHPASLNPENPLENNGSREVNDVANGKQWTIENTCAAPVSGAGSVMVAATAQERTSAGSEWSGDTFRNGTRTRGGPKRRSWQRGESEMKCGAGLGEGSTGWEGEEDETVERAEREVEDGGAVAGRRRDRMMAGDLPPRKGGVVGGLRRVVAGGGQHNRVREEVFFGTERPSRGAAGVRGAGTRDGPQGSWEVTMAVAGKSKPRSTNVIDRALGVVSRKALAKTVGKGRGATGGGGGLKTKGLVRNLQEHGLKVKGLKRVGVAFLFLWNLALDLQVEEEEEEKGTEEQEEAEERAEQEEGEEEEELQKTQQEQQQ
ncbi:hypothetical protein CBR_g54629 [Chara braunii]|uniref:Uncharacterized protein n=1 Tax=Chara braunii TaxID=69332 RepID=A0A388MC85_CHABU|nr:hypothetical protein CBR_g54629 [Chara braunii]|eukprot:GBG92184.1 hypothetical protein CBR_g54629 [Chara braunii]